MPALRDLTKDSITGHILMTASPLAISTVAQIAYQLLDLYFVARIGAAATAGVNAAATAVFAVNAFAQVLAAGTTSLIAGAVGRRDAPDATAVFNHALALSAICALAVLLFLSPVMAWYLRRLAADAATLAAGCNFIRWVAPAFALSLPMAVLSAALRAMGSVKTAVAGYVLSVTINALLAPVLIEGWGTGYALGVQGAGLATSISVTLGITFLTVRFYALRHSAGARLQFVRPRVMHCSRILSIGAPAGAEFSLLFLSMSVAYYAIRDLGVSAQAGFAIGSRAMQVILLPAMAVAMAAGPIAGQNFGARNAARVRETFNTAALIGCSLMLPVTILIYWQPSLVVGMFDADAAAGRIATRFLRSMSWSFIPQALVYTCSVMFQGLGNTVPSLISSSTRFLAFAVPLAWLSMRSTFRIEQIWHLLITATVLQACVSIWLLRGELRRRLSPAVV